MIDNASRGDLLLGRPAQPRVVFVEYARVVAQAHLGAVTRLPSNLDDGVALEDQQ